MIFGIGFRLILIALALVVERIGSLFRSVPWLGRLIASEPPVALDQDEL